MARHVRLAGLASLLLVDSEREIDDLIDHPALERDFEVAGPLVNRLILGGARRSVCNEGHVLPSFWPREDAERQRLQGLLFAHLDRLAGARNWSPEAIAAMARYVATGEEQATALAALTYVTAYPFLDAGRAGASEPFDIARFQRLYRLYRRLRAARRPLVGLPIRLVRADRRARRRLIELFGGDEYGLHAVAITLDNSSVVLDHLRTLAARRRLAGTPAPLTLDWASLRTAPEVVLRKIKEAFTLPHAPARLPEGTLVLMRMRASLAPDTRSGYEFAADHWSACPARRYMMAVFQAVCDAAAPFLVKRGAP